MKKIEYELSQIFRRKPSLENWLHAKFAFPALQLTWSRGPWGQYGQYGDIVLKAAEDDSVFFYVSFKNRDPLKVLNNSK